MLKILFLVCICEAVLTSTGKNLINHGHDFGGHMSLQGCGGEWFSLLSQAWFRKERAVSQHLHSGFHSSFLGAFS